MREPISRRPRILSDVLVGFAYLAHLRDDEERAQEIVTNIQAFGAGIAAWLNLVPSGASEQDALERLAQIYESDPVVDRFVRDTQHSQRLILEELDRWS